MAPKASLLANLYKAPISAGIPAGMSLAFVNAWAEKWQPAKLTKRLP